MSKGGISPSGRALRFTLWRLPLGITRLAAARNSAAATEHGRYVLALAGFGFWVAVFWFAASWWYQSTGMVVPLQIVGLLGLLLIWRIVGYLRRLWVHRHQLVAMAVNQQRTRQAYEMQAQVLGHVRQMAANVPRPGGEGGIDVLNLFRGQPHPTDAEVARTRRDQAREIREQLPEESRTIPLGDRPEPLVRMPRWMRRRGPK